MPYLVCDKCRGYYELKEGENSDDFTDECDCGGKLIYSEHIEDVMEDFPETKSSPKVDSGVKILDWFNKQSSGAKAAIGLGIICFIGLILIIGVSGMVYPAEKGYTVERQYPAMLGAFNDQRALEEVSPRATDAEHGYKVTDYGTKLIDKVTVYYGVYIDYDGNSRFCGDVFFQKNGKWYSIGWYDKPGNPNKKQIDEEITKMIRAT